MGVTLRHREGEHGISPVSGENLLYAGLRAGIPLPYECATGTCGTCRARVKTGTVTDAWAEAPGKAKLKTELGDILLCQSHAEGACEILIPGKVAARLEHRVAPRHETATVTNVRELNSEVITFDLVLGNPLEFLPGQFVAIRFAGLDGYRAYSMTSSYDGGPTLSFLVKRLPGGGASQQIFADGFGGQQIEIFGPLGGAVFQPEEDQNVLCIAGGSGVAGMLAILDAARRDDYFSNHHGHLFFGLRQIEDAFWLEELSAFAASNRGLEVTVALSDEPPPSHPGPGNLNYESGFVHEVAAKAMQGQYENTIAYVAGPPIMVDRSLRNLVSEGHLSADRIRYDKYA